MSFNKLKDGRIRRIVLYNQRPKVQTCWNWESGALNKRVSCSQIPIQYQNHILPSSILTYTGFHIYHRPFPSIGIIIFSSTDLRTGPFAMSAPGGAPSPAPRSGSMGPGANGSGMPMNSQQPMSGAPVHPPPTPGPPPPQSGAMSQQNLNQIVSCIYCSSISTESTSLVAIERFLSLAQDLPFDIITDCPLFPGPKRGLSSLPIQICC